jgi:hypothetical protein
MVDATLRAYDEPVRRSTRCERRAGNDLVFLHNGSEIVRDTETTYMTGRGGFLLAYQDASISNFTLKDF